MRITEMQRREPFVEILTETLSRGWSAQYAAAVRVIPAERAEGDLWHMQTLLSACYHLPLAPEARAFLCDGFRHTPVVWRRPAQWLLGTTLSSTYGSKRWSQPAFRVVQAPPEINSLLVVPGNQRLRVLNFVAQTCRVFLKTGFEAHTLRREIELRGGDRLGPFPRITQWGADGTWFEEPLLDAYALPRCPPGWDRKDLERRAWDLLDDWLKETTQTIDVELHVAALLTTLEHNLVEVETRLHFTQGASVRRWAQALAEYSRPLEHIPVAETHGDFQPGNVLINKVDRQVWLTDWEHSQRRYRWYDAFVYQYKTRSPVGLTERLLARQRPAAPRSSGWLSVTTLEYISALALCLLEDLCWYVAENTTGPYQYVSDGLVSYCTELTQLGPRLERLLAAGSA
jgi:hypothetical protein